MLVTFHAAAGAVIGENINHAYWAFAFGFASHFLLDFIPHGDRNHITEFAMGKRMKFLMGTRAADAVATLAISILIFRNHFFLHPVSVAWGIVGAAMPDFIVGIYELSRWKPLKWFYHYHHLIHNAYRKFEITFWHANFWQAIVILGILRIL